MKKRLEILEMRLAATPPELLGRAPARFGNVAAVAFSAAPAPANRPLTEARRTVRELAQDLNGSRSAKFNYATDTIRVELL